MVGITIVKLCQKRKCIPRICRLNNKNRGIGRNFKKGSFYYVQKALSLLSIGSPILMSTGRVNIMCKTCLYSKNQLVVLSFNHRMVTLAAVMQAGDSLTAHTQMLLVTISRIMVVT